MKVKEFDALVLRPRDQAVDLSARLIPRIPLEMTGKLAIPWPITEGTRRILGNEVDPEIPVQAIHQGAHENLHSTVLIERTLDADGDPLNTASHSSMGCPGRDLFTPLSAGGAGTA